MIIELTTYSKRAWYKVLSFAKIYSLKHRNIQCVENKETLCIEILMDEKDYCYDIFKKLFHDKYTFSKTNQHGLYITIPYNYDVELQKVVQKELKTEINYILTTKYNYTST